MRNRALTRGARRPSVGATVQYFTRRPDEQLWGNDGGPYAAIVSKRREESLVALAVLPPFSAKVHAVGWVRHSSEAGEADAWWDWPEQIVVHDKPEKADGGLIPDFAEREETPDLAPTRQNPSDSDEYRRNWSHRFSHPNPQRGLKAARRRPPEHLKQLRLPGT